MRDNVIRMQLQDGMLWADEGLFQYDYGQRLILEGIELPPVYEIHFSNSSLEDSKICIGDETGIDIPDEYLQTGARCWSGWCCTPARTTARRSTPAGST